MLKDIDGSILDAPTVEEIAEDMKREEEMLEELNTVESHFINSAKEMLDNGFSKTFLIKIICSLFGE